MISNRKNKKVLVAMSGGVDSSVSAALLKEQGYDVSGVFMIFQKNELPARHYENKCCSQEAMARARQVATKLNIPFYVMDFSAEFQKRVIDYFTREYKNGRTPNPCMVCNKFIKLGLFLDRALAMGFDYVATGHYVKKVKRRAQKEKVRNWGLVKTIPYPPPPSFLKEGGGLGRGIDNQELVYKLFEARDKTRDQSYFLHTLTQDKLAHLLFPLGNYLKSQVWQLAKERDLPISKTESRGICFIKDNNVADFLARVIKFKPGPIKDIKTKKTLGEHHGLQPYTIGQRQAIGIGGTGPYYVVKLDLAQNTLWVTNNPKDSALFVNSLVATNVHWISGQESRLPFKCQARIRYGHKTASCVIISCPRNDNQKKYSVKFSKPQRAVTPGQSIVFYGQRHEMLGGGVIK